MLPPRRHPEWRIAQLDPHLLHLFSEALAPPQQQQQQQHQQQQQQQQEQQQPPQEHATGGGQADPTTQTGGPGEQSPGTEAASEVGVAANGRAEGGAEAEEQGASGRRAEQGAEQGTGAAVGKEGPQGAGQADVTGEAEAEAGEEGGGGAGGLGCGFGRWRGPRPQEHLAEYCRRCEVGYRLDGGLNGVEGPAVGVCCS